MLDRVVQNCAARPQRASADNGYLSEENVARASARGIDVYLAPGRIKHGPADAAAAPEGPRSRSA